MDETYLLQVLSIVFFSAWKTYIGPMIAAGSNFAYWEMLIFNMSAALGSAAGTLFVTDVWMAKRRHKAKGFNKNLRRILKFWRQYGKRTTLILSPVLLGIPSYALIARRLKETHTTIMLELAVITFLWCSGIYWAAVEGIILISDI